MIEVKTLVSVRPMREDEENFILNSWLRSLRAHSNYFTNIPSSIYFEAHGDSIRMNLSHSKVLVATPRDDDDIIIGYIVYEDRTPKYSIVHYVYVKGHFRKMGLAKVLYALATDSKPVFVTHITNKIQMRDMKFNPYFFKMERL